MNSLFVVLSCVLAHLIPSELLLISYAFLGPAHYLTEISWLHDRKYFLQRDFPVAPLLFMGGAAALLLPRFGMVFLSGAVALAFANLGGGKRWLKIAFSLLFFVILFLASHFAGETDRVSLFLTLLLPTVIHVFFFTLVFIIHGFKKNRDRDSLAALVLIAVACASFALFPDLSFSLWPQWTTSNIALFQHLARAIEWFTQVAGGDLFYAAMIKFFAFSYTFHYLNWFAKTKLTAWHQLPRSRLVAIAVLYAVFSLLYLYDYTMGLKALLYLSLLHVILELPLNIVTIKNLAVRGPKDKNRAEGI